MEGDLARERHVKVPRLYPGQRQVVESAKRFNVLCAGRRWGKSSLGIERATDPLLAGLPVAWFAPTYKSLDEFWRLITNIYAPITVARSEQQHRLEIAGGGSLEMWSLDNPDSARGRHYARVILDECAVVRNLLDAWNYVIRSTLIDLEGDAWFLSTPKGRNDFARLWDVGHEGSKTYDEEWASWQHPSRENPYLPPAELEGLRLTMPLRAYEQEVEARFIDEVTGALWRQADIEQARVSVPPPLARVVVAIDPAGSSGPDSDETGIVAVGVDGSSPSQGYVLADASGTYTPDAWARKAIALYETTDADCIVAEANYGGEMVRHTLKIADPGVPVKLVTASRGKAVRAEPISALYEQHRVHHVGRFDALELQLTTWSPLEDRHSPDRLDALVWGLSRTMLRGGTWSAADIDAMGRRWTGTEKGSGETFAQAAARELRERAGMPAAEPQPPDYAADVAEANRQALIRARGW